MPSRPCSIVLLFSGSLERLWRCLESLVRTTRDDLFEVVIVTAGADDDSKVLLAGLEGDVSVLHLDAGTSRGAALDAGAAAAAGELLIFVDEGTELRHGWLDGLVRRVADDPGIALAAPRVLAPDGSRRTGDGLLRAALMARRGLFEQAGGFGDGDEAGLTAKVEAAGARLAIAPASTVANDELVDTIDRLPAEAPERRRAGTARPFTELRDRHAGQDVWVLASGPSMSWVDPSFFEGKVTVGVNDVWRKYETTYLIRKEHDGAQAAIDTGSPLVVSRLHCGNQPPQLETTGVWYEYDHELNRVEADPDLRPIGTPDKLVVSWSTITSAIHFAAYLGAANIIVCGHDCGFIDGIQNYTGYRREPVDEAAARALEEWARGFHPQFLSGLERQTMLVRDRVREVYGCNVHGLNPFVTLALEGHVYERATNPAVMGAAR